MVTLHLLGDPAKTREPTPELGLRRGMTRPYDHVKTIAPGPRSLSLAPRPRHPSLAPRPRQAGLDSRLWSIAPPSLRPTRLFDPSSDLSAGHILAGKYMLTRRAGSGGMGVLWQGIHIGLGTTVAIKLIRAERAASTLAREQFEFEAQCAARVRSKHVVHIYDYGVADGGVPYVVMEYLRGESLMSRIFERGALPMREATHLIARAAAGLAAVHAAGIVHGDVKPDNLMLVGSEEEASVHFGYDVKLIDFGVATCRRDDREGDEEAAIDAGWTLPAVVVGTPNFMPPERFLGLSEAAIADDLWGLATSAFTVVTGAVPFEGASLTEILPRLCSAPLPIPSSVNADVPPEFDAWFARACARDPKARFGTALELAAGLERACADYEMRLSDALERWSTHDTVPSSERRMRGSRAWLQTLDDVPLARLA